jgi:hypothetical protein
MMWSPDRYDNAGPWFLGTKAIVGNRTDDKVKKHLQEHAGREWWRGKAKGMLQILFERGHIDPKDAAGNKHWQAEWGTVNKKKYEPTDEDVKQKRKKSADGSYGGKKIASATLAAMEDYLGEVSIIENVFLEKGHLLQASPRYHPAMALSTPGWARVSPPHQRLAGEEPDRKHPHRPGRPALHRGDEPRGARVPGAASARAVSPFRPPCSHESAVIRAHAHEGSSGRAAEGLEGRHARLARHRHAQGAQGDCRRARFD